MKHSNNKEVVNTSPINALVDKACGSRPKERRDPGLLDKERADHAATNVLDYIDRIYPEMWAGTPLSARRSLRAVIVGQVEMAMKQSADVLRSENDRLHKAGTDQWAEFRERDNRRVAEIIRLTEALDAQRNYWQTMLPDATAHKAVSAIDAVLEKKVSADATRWAKKGGAK